MPNALAAVNSLENWIERAAWATSAFVVLAYLTQTSPIAASIRSLQAHPAGRIAASGIVVAWIVTALLLWALSMLHAWRRWRAGSGSLFALMLVVVANVPGSLVYYFVTVRASIRTAR